MFQSGEDIGNKYLNTISGIAPNYCIVQRFPCLPERELSQTDHTQHQTTKYMKQPVPDHSGLSLVGDPKTLQPVQRDPVCLQLVCHHLVNIVVAIPPLLARSRFYLDARLNGFKQLLWILLNPTES